MKRLDNKTEKYKERPGDVIISLGDGRGLVLEKARGTRFFLEVHREIKDNKPTGAYYRFAEDENKNYIPDFIDGKPVLVKEKIDSYFPKMEKFMNQNKKVQSIKLEIRLR